MKRASLTVLLSAVLFLSGCSNYTTAQRAYGIVEAVLSVAEADLPSLQAAGAFSAQEGTVISGYLQLVGHLNDQYGSCITNAQNTMLATKSKFLACLNDFSAGLADPKELAALRVLNPNAQKKVQLWIVAFQVGVNSVIAALGGQGNASPSIAAAPTAAELQQFRIRVENQMEVSSE